MGSKLEHNAPQAMKNLAVGDTFLDGRFHLIEPIGKGDFGVAWVAHDPVRHNEATLKYLLDCASLDEAGISKFCDDTKWSLFQDRPNIVRVFELQEPSAADDVVRALVYPTDDDNSGTGNPFFDVSDIQDWIKLICETLKRVHHRRISTKTGSHSQNEVFVRENNGDDFDFEVSDRVTQTVDRLTGASSIFTTAYGSPEQALGAAFDEKQDVYAVGALIYDLLTGRPPFFHADVLSQIQQVKPPSMTERRREFHIKGGLIPQRWEEMVASCLAKDPGRRPDFDSLITHLFKEAGPMTGKKGFPFAAFGIVMLGVVFLSGLGSWKGSPNSRAISVASALSGETEVAIPSHPPKPPPLSGAILPPEDQVYLYALGIPNPPKIDLPDDVREMPPVRAERVFANLMAPEPKPLPLAPSFLPLDPEPPAVSKPTGKEGKSFLLEDIGMEMVWIEPLDSWVAKSEVTREQFTSGGGKGRKKFQESERAQDSVTWDEAMEFCKALSEREKQRGQLPPGFIYTLPTEEQWEVYVGDADLDHAVFGGRESSGPSAPGSRPGNQYGLVDVRGNLWEWTLTDYSPGNPAKGKALRGGSYVTSGTMIMNENARFYGTKDNSYFQYGFRVVLTSAGAE